MTKLPKNWIADEAEDGDLLDGKYRRGPGRPTVGDEVLRDDRDALVWSLSMRWGDCGWQIQNASTAEELRQAFEPLRGNRPEHLIAHFLRATSTTSTASEVRSMKKIYGKAVERDRDARENHDNRAEIARKAELAMNQAAPEQPPILQAELLKSWGESTKTRKELEAARASLKAIEDELADKSASFAQNELLHYIKLKKYARHPLGLADAMAGLPDMSWENSHTRCSKLKYEQWPTFEYKVFEELRAIWNRRDSFPELSTIQLFRQEIEKLPKKIMVDYPRLKKKIKQDNHLRSHLCERAMYLRLAIEGIEKVRDDTRQMPYVILSAFRKRLDEPQTAQQLILAKRESIS